MGTLYPMGLGKGGLNRSPREAVGGLKQDPWWGLSWDPHGAGRTGLFPPPPPRPRRARVGAGGARVLRCHHLLLLLLALLTPGPPPVRRH